MFIVLSTFNIGIILTGQLRLGEISVAALRLALTFLSSPCVIEGQYPCGYATGIYRPAVEVESIDFGLVTMENALKESYRKATAA